MSMTKASTTLLTLVLSAAGVRGQMEAEENARFSMQRASMEREENAGNARWLLRAMPWGSMTNSAGDPMAHHAPDFEMPDGAATATDELKVGLFANTIPFGSDKESGRVFFYFKGEHDLPGATLTVSQGGVNPALFAVAGCGTSEASVVDIQDPQCTKLSVSGDAYHCGHHGADREECNETGKAALFAVHEGMKDWPEDEYFVHELFPREDGFWMINAYGGDSGKNMGGIEGFTNAPEDKIVPHDIGMGFTYEPPAFAQETLPKDPAAKARWIAHGALWATVSTLDDAGEGYTFGNPRSISDGATLATSSGLPVFNVPDADATAGDLAADNMRVAVTFDEGQAFGSVSEDGALCGGLCGAVVLHGRAVPLTVGSEEYEQALANFKVTHPMAEWLWEGGSHMTSKYYTVIPTRVLLFDSPEQAAQNIGVSAYLDVKFSEAEGGEVKVHKLVKNEEDAGLGEEEPDNAAASWSKSAVTVLGSLAVVGAAAL